MSITLKAARVNMRMTQAQAAKKIGIALYTLQNYEAGKTFPDVPIIKKIEAVYGVPFAEINFFCR